MLSRINNDIATLKAKYQEGGASTLISRAKSDVRVPERKELSPDPETGERRYLYTGKAFTKWRKNEKTGEWENKGTELRTTNSKRLAETSDAYELSSGTRIESVYASYSNKLKALANLARKEAMNLKPIQVLSSAKQAFSDEIKSLKAKLNIAERNAPLERQAQAIANKIVAIKIRDNPDLSKDEVKRLKQQALAEARLRTGASKKERMIDISQREWIAIQSGAVSTSFLKRILNNTDTSKVKQMALPRESKGMSAGRVAKARSMLSNGYTQAEVADYFGVSVSTLRNALD